MILGVGALTVTAMPVLTQQLPAAWQAVARPTAAADSSASGARPPVWLPPAASAVVPGSGQLLQGQSRGAIYLAVEGLLLVRFFSFQTEGRRESDRYRDLAFAVARAPFEPSVRDTVFEYFEQMGRYVESGPFDSDPGPGLVPPTDERTYNGNIWALARSTFFTNPDSIPDVESEEYQRALQFYRSRAIGTEFLWSWRNAGLEQDLYRQSIRRSDEGFRRATEQLGLLLANHLISAVDAFVTGRLGGGSRVAVHSALGLGSSDDGVRWAAVLRVAF
ncbi:MAG: hypothetical protein IH616_04620 [Gemmatimonadales bacterium]|nr:hypothetical protein [Gemmatimonadales bacterium]